jgi:hypothetical protein
MADANVAITQVTTAGVVVFLINWLKKSPMFPWITAESGRLLRILAIIGAGVGAVGIHYTWNPEAHALTITGLSLVGILTAGAIWLKSFVTQEIIYQSTSSGGLASTLKEILSLLKAIAPNPSRTDSTTPVAPAAK